MPFNAANAKPSLVALINHQMMMAPGIHAGDLDAMEAYYADDARFYTGGVAPHAGKQEIREAWRDIMACGYCRFEFDADDFIMSASQDMVYERGTYKRFGSDDNTDIVDEGHFVVVWQRVDDQWKILADIVQGGKKP